MDKMLTILGKYLIFGWAGVASIMVVVQQGQIEDLTNATNAQYNAVSQTLYTYGNDLETVKRQLAPSRNKNVTREFE